MRFAIQSTKPELSTILTWTANMEDDVLEEWLLEMITKTLTNEGYKVPNLTGLVKVCNGAFDPRCTVIARRICEDETGFTAAMYGITNNNEKE